MLDHAGFALTISHMKRISDKALLGALALAVLGPPLPAGSAEPGPDTAQICGPIAAPISTSAPELFTALASAESEYESRGAEDAIWLRWIEAPDPTAQALLDEGMRRIRQSDFEGAEKALTTLIARCPDYAEGYNQRAYARFLAGKFDRSLEDITRALNREPKHFAALSGRIRILFSQGRTDLAREALTEAIKIHPWLRERRMLPIEPIEDDI